MLIHIIMTRRVLVKKLQLNCLSMDKNKTKNIIKYILKKIVSFLRSHYVISVSIFH